MTVEIFKPENAILGAELAEVPAEWPAPRGAGVMVAALKPTLLLATSGKVFVGDVLLEVDGCPVADSTRAAQLMREKQGALRLGLLGSTAAQLMLRPAAAAPAGE